MKHKRHLAGIKSGIIIFMFVFLISGILVMAAQNYQLLQIGVEDGQIVAYMEGDADVSEIDCQIGMIPCEKVNVTTMADAPFSFHTIVLIDNSLSITQENKEKAIELLKTYMQQKSENEYVSIAIFGENIDFLIEKSNDAQALQDAIDSISQNNQDTYLTDILYNLLDTLDVGEYTRFFVLSDGVDNKAIGITKEELTEKLKINSHPIYTLGHVYGNNEAELENMFSLSRATGGKEFLLDEAQDLKEIVSQLGNTQGLMRVSAVIPKEISDGSSKNILFTMKSNAGEYEVKGQIDLPFSLLEATPEPTLAPTPEPTQEPSPAPELTPEPAAIPVADSGSDGGGMLLLLILFLLIAAVVVFIFKGKKGKKKEVAVLGVPEEPHLQQNQKQVQMPDPEMTVMLDRRYLLVLKDIKDSGRIFRYPMDDKVVIGRNTDKVNIAIDYNLTVSGQHCEIYVRHNRFYIRDLNSSNKTFVNGIEIHTETEITSGCMIRVGEVEFSVEMLPI